MASLNINLETWLCLLPWTACSPLCLQILALSFLSCARGTFLQREKINSWLVHSRFLSVLKTFKFCINASIYTHNGKHEIISKRVGKRLGKNMPWISSIPSFYRCKNTDRTSGTQNVKFWSNCKWFENVNIFVWFVCDEYLAMNTIEQKRRRLGRSDRWIVMLPDICTFVGQNVGWFSSYLEFSPYICWSVKMLDGFSMYRKNPRIRTSGLRTPRPDFRKWSTIYIRTHSAWKMKLFLYGKISKINITFQYTVASMQYSIALIYKKI